MVFTRRELEESLEVRTLGTSALGEAFVSFHFFDVYCYILYSRHYLYSLARVPVYGTRTSLFFPYYYFFP